MLILDERKERKRPKFRAVERAELEAVELPGAGGRSRWKGVRHGELLGRLEEACAGVGLVPDQTRLYLSKDSHECAIALRFRPADRAWELPEVGLCLGAHHDNLSRRALKLSVGGEVYVCSNGLVSMRTSSRRLHTRRLELKEYLGWAADKLVVEGFRDQAREIRRMKNRILPTAQGARMILEAGLEGSLSWSGVAEAAAAWLARPAPEMSMLWDWYNVVNVPVKRLAVSRQAAALEQLWRVAKSLN